MKKDDLTNQQSDLQKDNLRPTDTKEGLSIDSSVKEQPDDLKEKGNKNWKFSRKIVLIFNFS